MGILVLFRILEGKLQLFLIECGANCGFAICEPYCIAVHLLHTKVVKIFILR
ncbi:rCG60354 [Rattus norvegicus]|uniref:RCG60354 n=1 Tax=Rattus norvegicus TaxID=10116 RepID=A6KJE8_RAT|nr:rCG60354 [Rattus norvegicus]